MAVALTAQELAQLSELLLSEEQCNLEIAFQILNSHADSIAILQKELVLIAYCPQQDSHCSEHALNLLEQVVEPAQLREWENGFQVFKFYHTIYTTEEFETNWHWFEKHEAHRLAFLSLLVKSRSYTRAYFAMAEVLVTFYAKGLAFAERYYQLALSYAPNNVEILNRLANLALTLYQNPHRALTAYCSILEQSPKHYDTIESVISLHLDYLKNPHKALEMATYALENYPNDENFELWFASASVASNQPATVLKGVQWLQQMIALEPYCATAWVIYGKYLCQKGLLEQALTVYQEALVYHSDNANILGKLAALLSITQQDYTQAESLYVQSLSIYLDNCVHLGNFIVFLVLKLKDLERAKDYYQHLCSLFFEGVNKPIEWNETQWHTFQQVEQTLWQHYPSLQKTDN